MADKFFADIDQLSENPAHKADFIQKDPQKNSEAYLRFKMQSSDAEKGNILVLAHDQGGGADMYLDTQCSFWLAQSNNVFILRYVSVSGSYCLRCMFSDESFELELAEWVDLEYLLRDCAIDQIIVNELVTFPALFTRLSDIRALKWKKKARLTMLIHDYLAVSPSYNLISPQDWTYAREENGFHCDRFYEQDDWAEHYDCPSISAWRQRWENFLLDCDEVRCFSEDSRRIMSYIYPELQNITVIPHVVSYVPEVHKERKTTETLNIGVLGILAQHKGRALVRGIWELLERENRNIKIILIGYLNDGETIPIGKHFEATGEYNVEDLPQLVLEKDIDLFLMPSICPETFSFTTEEIIKMGLPIACLDMGAPAERVRNYEKGLVLSSGDPQMVFMELVAFARALHILPAPEQINDQEKMLTKQEQRLERERIIRRDLVKQQNERFTAQEQIIQEQQVHITQLEAQHQELKVQLSQCKVRLEQTTTQLASASQSYDAEHQKLLYAESERDSTAKRLTLSEAEKTELQARLEQTTAQLAVVSESFDIISNSHIWRATRPIRVVLDSVKTIPFFNLSIKGLKSLKANGIAFTWRKIRRWEDSKKYIETTNDEGSNKNIVLYESDYQANQDYSIYTTDIKMLAFYLPQYHTFPENDAWWGTGFTEWTNVKKSVPRFEGHYQPRVPHADIGYYCLEDIEVMRKQAALAKQHGIYGFCFYYYWFSGKRLMEKPVDQLLEHPEIDIPFCLCWANENWTRRWDGQDQDVFIKQNYTDEDDEQFIIDIKKYVDDPRYIRVDEAPVIIIYNPTAMPDCRKSFTKWRETARRIGVGEIKIWICLTWGRDAEMLRISDLVDAEVEFPPHNIGGDWMELKDIKREGRDCIIYDYYRGVEYIIGKWKKNGNTLLPRHYTCMLAWDNSARRRDGWHAFYHFSLKELYRWLTEAVRQSRAHLRPEERFIFVNAWNEWGEGTYLEPEEKYGYANINTVSKALFDLPLDWNTTVINEQYPIAKDERVCKANPPRIAVQIHVFFIELVDELIKQLNSIPYPFDLFITTDTESKKETILSAFEERCRCTRVEVLVLENRGRDVAPLLVQLAPVIGQYDYFGHFHTKKTVTADYGDDWRNYLFSNLLGCEGYVKRVFGLFEGQKELGIVFPELYPPIREHAKWNGENEGIRALLARMNCSVELPEQLAFPAGNMFWARTEAVKPLFELGLTQADFPEECGQRYATIAHQIERSWAYIAQSRGFSSCYIMNGVSRQID